MVTRRPSKLRQIAKSIPGLYWLAGLARYLRFRRDLRRANRGYDWTASTLPPPMLRYRVHGALDEASYLEVGRSIASQLVQCLSAHGIALDDATLLDFACGPGRVAAELKSLAPSCRLHGSDIDRDAIGWARDHLRHVGSFEVNDPAPPTRYPACFFDVAYSVSLFTHLDEPSQELWLEELARVLKPGGVLLVTTHGKFALASCTDAELGEFDRRGFVHRVDRKGRFKLDGLPDFYQTTFHTREYVNRAWSRHFDVVDHIEGGLGRHQDVVLLRSTEGGSPAQAGPSNPDFDPAVHRERVRKWQESNGDERLLTRYDRLNADSIILDLGGYHGDFSFHMNSKYGALCHVFEVVPELCSRIESARAGNPKIVVHAFGLAGSTRKERLFLAEQGSSTFANRAPEARQIAIQLVEASDWFRKELEGRSVDLMKINIEGGEYELLEHMIRKGLARRVRNIQVQFHEDVIADAAARMGRIQADLSKTHRLTFQERFVWENWELLDRDETNFC